MSKRLSQLGEFGLIELLKRYQGSSAPVMKGIGDDTAVVPLDDQRYLLLTTDMLLEGVHFERKAPPRLIGHKALACSVSDIAAMGGRPRYALVSLGVPGGLSWTFVRDLYKGMDALARQLDVAIVGGDTVKSAKVLINIALTGEAKKTEVVYRKGAQPGDIIFVTGVLGRSLSTGWHLKFIPRVKEAQYLVRYLKPTAMIDISDGLAADLGHILKASRVGAMVEEGLIPRRAGASACQALYDGEDFELIFTIPPRTAASLRKQYRFPLYPVGAIVASPRQLMIRDQKNILSKISPQGYTHF